jgi:muramidase (phage lysozyme)
VAGDTGDIQVTTREVIVAALGNANVKAWQQVVRHRESSHDDNAYYEISGGGAITSLDKYPWPNESTEKGWKAVGAGQFIPHTWYGLARQYPDDCKDFSKYAQDFGIVALTAGRGALQDVISGDIITAIKKCHEEWTSLPGAAENKRYTMDEALHVFQQYGGGATTQPAAPIEDKSTEVQTTGERTMGAIAIPLLAQLLPQIFSLFSGKAQAAISKATGADPATAGQFMQSMITQIGTAVGIPVTDNASATQAVAAVTAQSAAQQAATVAGLESYTLDQLAPILDKLHGYSKDEWSASELSVQAARAANAAQAALPPEQLWLNPSNLFGVMIMLMVGFVVVSVLWKDAIIVMIGAVFNLPSLLKEVPGFSTDMQAYVIGAIVGSSLTALIAYIYGSNRQSAAKDATIQQLSKDK